MLDRIGQDTLFDLGVPDHDAETAMERRRQFARRQRRAFLAPIIESPRPTYTSCEAHT